MKINTSATLRLLGSPALISLAALAQIPPSAAAGASMDDWVVANETTAKVLAARGYHYQFVFAKSAGHTDGAVKRQTLGEALEYLWQDYPIAK